VTKHEIACMVILNAAKEEVFKKFAYRNPKTAA
jgi:hypothetical protein